MYLLWEFIVDIWDVITIGISDALRRRRSEKKTVEGYLTATPDTLRGAVGQDVFSIIIYRLKYILKMNLVSDIEGLMKFNASQRIFWVANAYEQKNDGVGLCGFLVSEYGYTAPIVPWVLKALGAEEHLRAFCEFIQDSGIDLNNMSEFDLRKLRAKKKSKVTANLKKKYSFGEFDKKYLELQPLEELLLKFARENAEEILAINK